jgi:hypothetical protein
VLSDPQARADRHFTASEFLLEVSAAEMDAGLESASTGFVTE